MLNIATPIGEQLLEGPHRFGQLIRLQNGYTISSPKCVFGEPDPRVVVKTVGKQNLTGPNRVG